MSAERGHVLVVTLSADSIPEEPTYDRQIECLAPPLCGGWEECTGDHDGYDPDDEDSPAYDRLEDVEIHGVEHTWRSGYGWTVPFDGCVVADKVAMWDVDSAYDIAQENGVGRHVVDDDWDDTDLTLYFVETLEEA